ncbi:MFS transporter [Bifidobacterium sp. ESL0763]|uniref:MFS transporter n=1 Tax=Bifidobacterium sp. ESL0763 TaxID=2983227 RepID=UPI0023F799A6|nr:MFS transporter [Bifidobacterium sp. ESL0763]MDF7664377.1 MFS transporter [Bifidobacterium sp. ESL0763]
MTRLTPAAINGSRQRSPLLTPNFVLLVAGLGVSLFGNMTLRFAMSMWTLDATGSATTFASLLAVSIVPTIVCSPLGGIMADRVNRRTIMVGLDALSALATLAATLYFESHKSFNIVAVGALMVVLAVLDAFETPTVQAALPQIVGTGDEGLLRRGMAVVNQVQQLASLLPSFIGGIFYAAVGIKPTMLITVACFAAATTGECFLRLGDPRAGECQFEPSETAQTAPSIATPGTSESTALPRQSPARPPQPTPFDDAKAAWRFLTRERPNILRLMATATLLNFFTAGYSGVGFPYMVRNVLGFGATAYGTCDGLVGAAGLLGAFAAGAFAAGAFAARLSIERFPATCLALAATIVPCGVAFVLPVANGAKLAIVVVSMCGSTVAAAFTNLASVPAIQLATPQALSGKVLALLSSFVTAAQPFGQLAYGLAYDRLPAQWPTWLSAAGIAAMVLLSAPVFLDFDGDRDVSALSRTQ